MTTAESAVGSVSCHVLRSDIIGPPFGLGYSVNRIDQIAAHEGGDGAAGETGVFEWRILRARQEHVSRKEPRFVEIDQCDVGLRAWLSVPASSPKIRRAGSTGRRSAA